MTVLITILAVLILVFLYVLFAPIYLEADSERNLLGVRFHHLANARVMIRDDSLMIDLNIAGWKKAFDLLKKKERTEKPRKVKSKPVRSGFPPDKIKAILQSFKVNTCYFNIDLGNVEWNGVLYPVFFWLGRITGKPIAINFLGINEVRLEVENNAARIIRAYIFSK